MPILVTSTGFFYKNTVETSQKTFKNDRTAEKISIVTTAARQKEKNIFVRNAVEDFLAMGFSNKQIEFFDFDTNSSDHLLSSTIIFINGGNPFYLLQSIRENNGQPILNELLKKKAYIIGVSAGALVLGPGLELVNAFTPHLNTFDITDLTALNLCKDYLFPHYDRSDLFGDNIEEKITTFEHNTGKKVLRLKDNENLFYP